MTAILRRAYRSWVVVSVASFLYSIAWWLGYLSPQASISMVRLAFRNIYMTLTAW